MAVAVEHVHRDFDDDDARFLGTVSPLRPVGLFCASGFHRD
jgi:hypothetical protein